MLVVWAVLALWPALTARCIGATAGSVMSTGPPSAAMLSRFSLRTGSPAIVKMRGPWSRSIRVGCHQGPEPRRPSRTCSALFQTMHQTMRLCGRQARDIPMHDRLRIVEQFSESVTELLRRLDVVSRNLHPDRSETVVSGVDELAAALVLMRDQLEAAGVDADTEISLQLRIFGMLLIEKLDELGVPRPPDVELAQTAYQIPQIYRLLLSAYAMAYFAVARLET